MNPKFDQLAPPSIEYCQRPSARSTACPRTATPANWFCAGLPASVGSLKLAKNRLATVAPPGDTVSSLTAASTADPLACGASLTAVPVTFLLPVSGAATPSLTLVAMLKLAL